MEITTHTPVRDDRTAEILLFIVSALSGLLGLSLLVALIWETSSYRNGISDTMVPISLLVNMVVFPAAAAASWWLYKRCCDTFSRSLRAVVVTWQSIALLAWLFCAGVVIFGVFVWLSGGFMWNGENLTPPSWSPLA